MDSQGRFTLNQRIKEMSLLSNDSEVILEGNGGSIEIWNNEEYEKMHNTFDPNVGVYDLMDRANDVKTAGGEEE